MVVLLYDTTGGFLFHLFFELEIRVFMKVMEYFEFDIKIVQTDNGSEFLGEFDKYLNEIGIEHYFSYPRSPKTNL